jgi:hypothetical protein
MRFMLGMAFTLLLAGAASAQPGSMNFTVKNCTDCDVSNKSCRAACDGLGGPCFAACNDTRRICVRQHCTIAH